MATMPPSRTSITTTAPPVPLPSPITPVGAMICANARSQAYCTGPLMHRYRSEPRVGWVSLTTSTTLPLASAITRRCPWSPASRSS